MPSLMRNSNEHYLRSVIIFFLGCALIPNASIPVAHALEAGNVIGSSGIIGNPTWGDHTVIDTQNGAIINWNSFNTSGSQSVTFRQYDGAGPSSFSAVLNRISSGALPTQFDGLLNANGRVFVVNPAGVIFGAGSTVNAAQLVASGLNMSNDAFSAVIADENNRMQFAGGGGEMINDGTINTERSVYLVGKNVINNGDIHCPGGLVVMAAGDKLRLGQRAGNVIVSVEKDLFTGKNNFITDNGTVGDAHSPVAKLVLAAGDVFSQAVSNVANVASIVTDDPESGGVAADIVEVYSGHKADSSFALAAKKDFTFQSSTQSAAGKILLACKDEDKTPEPTGDPDTGSPDPTEPADPPVPPDSTEPPQEPDSQLTSLQRLWQEDAKLNSQTKDAGKVPTAQAAILAASVPLPDEPVVQISGCPALTKWAAKELGIGGGTAQISVADSPALGTSIPPCDACAGLRRAAGILRDYSGTHIVALSGVINEFASGDAPLSEEQDAAITAAIAGGAEGNTEYALAKEYLDALADYVAILNYEMDLSAADSTEFVLNKYIAPLAEDEKVGLATFLAAKLTTPAGS